MDLCNSFDSSEHQLHFPGDTYGFLVLVESVVLVDCCHTKFLHKYTRRKRCQFDTHHCGHANYVRCTMNVCMAGSHTHGCCIGHMRLPNNDIENSNRIMCVKGTVQKD